MASRLGRNSRRDVSYAIFIFQVIFSRKHPRNPGKRHYFYEGIHHGRSLKRLRVRPRLCQGSAFPWVFTTSPGHNVPGKLWALSTNVQDRWLKTHRAPTPLQMCWPRSTAMAGFLWTLPLGPVFKAVRFVAWGCSSRQRGLHVMKWIF